MAGEATLQEQAKALGDPTRHQIFQYIADSDHSVDVAELTSHFGLNHNAIRQHLAKLVNAGLITQETSPGGTPGRPRLIFRLEPAADSRWGTMGPYQRLSMLLVDMIASGSTAEETGRRAGRELEVRTPTSADDRIAVVYEAVARGGFHPEIESRGESLRYVLDTCPFADAAAADPETVCGLHLGLAQGLADQLEGVTVDRLIPRDPHGAGCILEFHTDPPASQRTSPDPG